MIDQLLDFTSPLAIAAMLAFGVLWGVVLARVLAFTSRISVSAAVGASFLLVQSGIRGIESDTPELSVARNLGSLVLWAVFMVATALTWRIAGRKQ